MGTRYTKTSHTTSTDTPIKTECLVTIPERRTMAADVEARVTRDLESSCCVVDIDAFLKQFFPIPPEDVDAVYQQMLLKGFYCAVEKGWQYDGKPMTRDSKKEAPFYDPLVSICEAIRQAIPQPNVGYSCRWFKSPDKAPASSDVKAPLIRPDIFLLLGMYEEVKQWEEKLKAVRDTLKEFEALTTAWWRRVGVVMEVKPKESIDVLDHINQLMGYLRQIFREQLDRMFVPGLLFTGTQLAVWVVDRSGAVGMAKSFNIHEEPKKFIQVILGCSSLPPERLGWDTTMKLWKQPDCIHSFSEQVTLDDYKNSIYERHWVIEMPAPDGQPLRERFVAVKALSVLKVESMNGRATVVWAALKLDQNGALASDEIYVLKQCWRPSTAKPEGELYPPPDEAAEHHIGQVYSYEDVKINGLTVTTQSFIRGNLDHLPALNGTKPKEEKLEENIRKRPRLEAEEPVEIYRVTILESDASYVFNSAEISIEHRVFSRILLRKSFGMPMHFFSSLPELVNVCSDVLGAIVYLYFHKKTLQRDISIGNILICPGTGNGNTTGCLIDFDYAKVAEVMKNTFIESASQLQVDPVSFELVKAPIFHGQPLPQMLANALARVSAQNGLYSYFNYVTRGIGHYVEESQLPKELSPTHLGFLDEDCKEFPDFSQRRPQTARRSATLPFASPEILMDLQMFPSEDYPSTPFHDLRHDVESLFWCMTFICVTRNGPGGERREELRPDYKGENTVDVQKLRVVNYTLFSADAHTLWDNKVQLFRNRSHYEEYIMPHFHQYFEPLKPLMKRWWEILQLAHRYPMLETIHLLLEKELDSTSKVLQLIEPTPENAKRTKKILERRREVLMKLRTALTSPQAQQSDIEAGIPPSRQGTFDLSPSSGRIEESKYHSGEPPASPTPDTGRRTRAKLQ